MSHKDVFGTIAVEISGIDAHTSLGLSVTIHSGASQKRIVDKRAVLLVDPELVGIPIVCNIDVYPTIVIEIRRNYSQAMPKIFVDSRRHSYLFKGPLALVVKESIAWRAKDAWSAIVSRSGGSVTGGIIRNRKIGIVHDHQIQPAVTIVIEESCACGPARIVSPTLLCDVN